MAQKRSPHPIRREQIAEAALQFALSRGLAALTARSLAASMGLTSGALFRHYGGMEQVLGGLVDAVGRRLAATYPAEPDPQKALEAFVRARSRAVGGRLPLLRLLLSDELQRALAPRDRRRLPAMVRSTRRWVEAMIRAGQRSGVFRADMDAADLALLVLGLVQVRALGLARVPSGRDALLAAALQGRPHPKPRRKP